MSVEALGVARPEGISCRVRNWITRNKPFFEILLGLLSILVAMATGYIAYEANKLSTRFESNAARAAQMERTIALVDTIHKNDSLADLQRYAKEVEERVRRDPRYPAEAEWRVSYDDHRSRDELKLRGLTLQAEHAARQVRAHELRPALITLLEHVRGLAECLELDTTDGEQPSGSDRRGYCNRDLAYAVLGWTVTDLFVRMKPVFHCDPYFVGVDGRMLSITMSTMAFIDAFSGEKEIAIDVGLREDWRKSVCGAYLADADRAASDLAQAR